MPSNTPSAARRRVRRKEARPAEIVRAALALFAERGFAATKLEDVAKAAGIGKGTIYLYFPNKDDLFRAVVRQELLPNVEQLEALVASHTGSSAELIYRLAERFLDLLESPLTAIPKLVITEAGNFPTIARFYAEEVAGRGVALLSRVFARGVERGEFRPIDPAVAPPLLMAPFMLLILWKHSLGRHAPPLFDPRAMIALHLETLLRGLAPEPKR